MHSESWLGIRPSSMCCFGYIYICNYIYHNMFFFWGGGGSKDPSSLRFKAYRSLLSLPAVPIKLGSRASHVGLPAVGSWEADLLLAHGANCLRRGRMGSHLRVSSNGDHLLAQHMRLHRLGSNFVFFGVFFWGGDGSISDPPCLTFAIRLDLDPRAPLQQKHWEPREKETCNESPSPKPWHVKSSAGGL